MKRQQKIIVNAGTHGDEKIGLRVIDALKKLNINNGQLIFNIANPEAFMLDKRFVDQDLNRSFPGKKNGNYEQRRAYELLPIIKSADIVIDIHSTTSELKDALIVTKINKKTKEYIEAISPKYVLIMKATKNNALISNAKIGIAFEYGKDNEVKKVVDGIKNLLLYLKVIKQLNKKNKINRPIFFEIYKSILKPKGAKLHRNIKNYKMIEKDEIYASLKKKKIKAFEDFYPILFGEKNYKDIFGFAGRKI